MDWDRILKGNSLHYPKPLVDANARRGIRNMIVLAIPFWVAIFAFIYWLL